MGGSGGGGGLLFAQLLEHFAVLAVDDGSHFKLPLQGLNLALEGMGQLGHLKPANS